MENDPKFEGSRKAALAAARGRVVAKDIWSFARRWCRAHRDSRWQVVRSTCRRRSRAVARLLEEAELG